MNESLISNNDLSALTVELMRQGCALPSNVDKIAGGFFGDCLIYGQNVLKLFKKLPDADESFFAKSVQAYQQLSDVTDEITQRGVSVPKLLGFGNFSPAITLGHQQYYAWQLMTRVNGHALKLATSQPMQDKVFEDRMVREMARVAAKFHVQVEIAGKDIKTGSFLEDFQRMNIDPKMFAVVTELERYIASITPRTQSVTLLHGDFNPSNILKDANGGYGLIDWDLQAFGRPEHDLWYGFSFYRPQSSQRHPTKDLCREYNASAAQPIIEGLLVAYGLAQLLRNYNHHLNDRKVRHSPDKRGQILDDIKPRIVGLANRMHQLTGKKIFAEVRRDFSRVANPLERPLTRLHRIDNIQLT